jgi:hypothetical protein
MYHNFIKISGAHRMAPAMAAGVESRLWDIGDIESRLWGIGDIVKVVEDWERGNAKTDEAA